MEITPMPQCLVPELAPECTKGYKRYMNHVTVQGRTRGYFVSLALGFGIYGFVKLLVWRKNNKIAQKKKAEDQQVLMTAVERWLKNGKTFDY